MSRCGCSCPFNRVPQGLSLGLESQNRAVVAHFEAQRSKQWQGMMLGCCWGEVGDVWVWLWLPVQSCATGSRFGARFPKLSCCGLF